MTSSPGPATYAFVPNASMPSVRRSGFQFDACGEDRLELVETKRLPAVRRHDTSVARPGTRSSPGGVEGVGGEPATGRIDARRARPPWRGSRLRGARAHASGDRVPRRARERRRPGRRGGGRPGRVRQGVPRPRPLPRGRAVPPVAAPDRRERGAQPAALRGTPGGDDAARRGDCGLGGRGSVPRGGRPRRASGVPSCSTPSAGSTTATGTSSSTGSCSGSTSRRRPTRSRSGAGP